MDVSGLWTVEQLAAIAAAAIVAEGVAAASGRVREVPDVRTLRYYTTLGLLDRPQQMQGRTAYYGRRHLLQLVAIKRLQAQGRSLSEIQARLLHITDDELATLAMLPPEMELPRPQPSGMSEGAPASGTSCAPTASTPRGRFWAAEPSAAPPSAPPPAVQLAVGLSEETALLFSAARTPTTEDLSAVRAAAQPLLQVLRQRRLL